MNDARVLLMLLMLAAVPAHAQSDADRTAIRDTALNYILGWYTGDADRMESAIHPDLAKRLVYSDEDSRQSRLNHQSAMSLVLGTREGYGTQIPEDQRLSDVTILDIFENAASVKVDAASWVDYLHIVKWNGQWKIVNVLWELKPE